MNPTEKNALVARSKCYILLGQPENALKDAESALQIDMNFMKAIYQKAESLYYLGNFEYSLVYYHRGLHIRPDHEDFKLGVHKAQKAIENAIGSNCFPSIRKPSSSSSSANTKMQLASNTPTKQSDNADNSCTTNKSTTTTRESSCVSSKLGHQRAERTTPSSMQCKKRIGCGSKKSRMLRELGPDKEYLDNLINNPNIKCKYKENDCTIENCIRETVAFLNERQEFWRQQLPPNLKR